MIGKKCVKTIFKIMLMITLSIFILRKQFIDIYHIPSDSMKNSLDVNDYILINKWTFSPFSKQFLNPQLKRSDMAVFRIKDDNPSFFIKRCIGLPGETIKIDNNKLYINEKMISEPYAKLLYKIYYNKYIKLTKEFIKHKINLKNHNAIKRKGYLLLCIDSVCIKAIAKFSSIDSITAYDLKDSVANKALLRMKADFSLNQENKPETRIPYKGMQIVLNRENFERYKSTIENQEDPDIFRKVLRSCYTLNYTFKNDYYFMMGDNRYFAMDSRSEYYGLIPKKRIIGTFLWKILRSKTDS